MANRILSKKAQATLETTITMVVLILFLAGMFRIWLWMNNQIVDRQRQYNDTRVLAGTGADTYNVIWPMTRPPSLTESEVLQEEK